VDRPEDLQDVGLLGVDRRSLAGEPHARGGELAERRRAEAAQRQLQPGGRSWHPAGRRADVERLHRLGVEVDGHRHEVDSPFRAVLARRRHEEINQARLLPAPHHHESSSPEPGKRALNGKRGENGGDRSIDGIPPIAQHLRPGLSR